MRRKTDRKRNRKLLKIQRVSILLTVLIGILIICSVLLLRPWEKKALFISPIPQVLGKILAPKGADEEKINLLKKMLKKNNISFVDISISTGSAYLVLLENGEEIMISKDKPLGLQISSLQLILSRLTIEGKKIVSLDFRYEKPIVIFK